MEMRVVRNRDMNSDGDGRWLGIGMDRWECMEGREEKGWMSRWREEIIQEDEYQYENEERGWYGMDERMTRIEWFC